MVISWGFEVGGIRDLVGGDWDCGTRWGFDGGLMGIYLEKNNHFMGSFS